MVRPLAWLPRIGFIAASVFLLTATHAGAQRRRGGRERSEALAPSEGTLVVQATQEGAEVFVDEERVGTTPIEPLRLAPGAHTLRVRLPGYTEYSDVVHVVAGQVTEVPVDLFPLAHVLSIVTEPAGARVFVDGNFMGETPVEVDLLEGTHSIRLTLRGYEDAIREVQARAGNREELRVELVPLPPGALERSERTEWYEEPVTWIAIGGGAVAVAVAIVILSVTTSSGPSQIDQFCALPGGCVRLEPRW
jgi:hypothetical protein